MAGLIFWFSIALVVYVYAGYPLIIYFLAKLCKPLEFSPDFQPTVTLIFAALNEEKVIKQKIENCLALDYPRNKLQIIVADDGSTDETAQIAASYKSQDVELVSFPARRGKISALADAMKKARGEMLLLSDADNFYPSGALSEAVKYFSNPTVGAVSGGRNVIGASNLGKSEGLYWKYEEFIKAQETRLGSCVGVAGDLLAIRRSLYTPPPPTIINDDFYAALSVVKQGFRVIYAPEARSYHPVAATEKGEMERRARMVAGRYQAMFVAWKMLPFSNPVLVWQIFSHKYLRPLVPLAMILAFFANIVAMFSTYAWIFFSLQVIFYTLAWLGMIFKPTNLVGRIINIPAYLVNSNLAALVGLYRYAASRQSVMWNKTAR